MGSFPVILLGAVLLTAAVIDVRSQRIPNWLTLPSVLIFPAYYAIVSGLDGFLFSLGGLGAGFGLMILPYIARVMGAGDVKLMAVCGAALGASGALWSFIFTSVYGGLYALLVLLGNRGALGTILRDFWNALLLMRENKGFAYGEARHTGLPRLCYGLAIAAGTFTYMVLAHYGLWIFKTV